MLRLQRPLARVRLPVPRRRRGGPTAEVAPRLVLRFSVYAGLALIAAAALIVMFVGRDATANAERMGEFHAGFVADSILQDRLLASDFADPVDARRRAALDQLFRREVLVGGALRVKLYGSTGRVIYSNDHALIGTTPPDEEEVERALAGSPVSDVTSLNDEGGSGPDPRVLEAYVPVHIGPGTPVGVFELYQRYAPIEQSAHTSAARIAGVVALVFIGLYLALVPILRGVTRRLRSQLSRIEHQALHDDLTGLPNRTLFNDRVEQALLAAKRGGHDVAVMLVDLDRFKEVNDTLGHASGDRLLQELGRRLQTVVRGSDTVARLGGDEFGILAPTVAHGAAVHALAAKIVAELSRSVVVSDIELEVEASIGIALYPDHGEDVETLIRHADVAMYHSKQSHVPEFYAVERDHYSPGRLSLVGELRRAIEDGHLLLYYQPQVDAAGRLQGVEALVRWPHPHRGLLTPAEFVPLAEHTGLIRPLTRYVLDAAIRQSRVWADQGMELRVAVNVSARDLLDLRLPDEVAELLERHGVEASRLELEITENTILTDPVRARAILDRLANLGVRLAIDDFGAGNSSLGYLKRLPVHVLKIDKSFVLKMDQDQNDGVIVRSTIELGHNLGLAVVAEGVETHAAWHHLAQLGCDTVQGYYFGQPSPAAEITTQIAGAPVG